MKRFVHVSRGARRRGAVLAVALALLAIAGCGGGDGSTTGGNEASTVSATITKAELIKKGDAICRKTDAIQRSAYSSYTNLNPNDVATKAGEEEAIATVALPPIEAEIQELRALGAPKSDRAEISEILENMERGLRHAERVPGAVMSAIPEPSFQRVEKLATKYGFKDCAKAL